MILFPGILSLEILFSGIFFLEFFLFGILLLSDSLDSLFLFFRFPLLFILLLGHKIVAKI